MHEHRFKYVIALNHGMFYEFHLYRIFYLHFYVLILKQMAEYIAAKWDVY
jgi:hypothetical protein